MRVFLIAVLVLLICVTGTVVAAPDEAPAAEKTVAQNVSVQLMDFGEGADRKIKLTLSDKWTNLPVSTKKHVLAKLSAVLPEKSLKTALLALAKGETEIVVSAAPGQSRVTVTPMVRLVPAVPYVPATPLVLAKRIEPQAAQRVIILGGQPGKAGTAVRMRLGEADRNATLWEDVDEDADGCFSCGAGGRKAEVKVMVAGDGNWKELPADVRKQVLESLRQTVPPEQMADVLKALMHGGTPRAGSFLLKGMPGKPGCGCGRDGATPPALPWFHGRQFGAPGHPGMVRRGGRAPGGGSQDALVRALVALTHEVRALRREVAAMRGAHQSRPQVIAPQPPRRVMRSMGVGRAAGTAPKVVIRKAKCTECQGECKCGHKPPPTPPNAVHVVTGKHYGKMALGGRVMPSAGGVMIMPQANRKNAEVEQDMAKLRAEMAEIRAALHRLMKELKTLQTAK